MFNNLDHVAIVGKSLERLSRQYTSLGFTLTEPSRHQTRDSRSGELITAGTANRCAMLRGGYLELLAAVDETLDCRGIPELAQHYEGIHIAAFGVEEPEDELARLEREGFSPYLNELSRSVHLDGQARVARFEQLRIAPQTPMEARTFGIRHLTPELLWRTESMEHPNTAVALTSMQVLVDDLPEARSRYRRLLGTDAADENGSAVFCLDRGSIEVVDRDAMRSVVSEPDELQPGRCVGFTISVASLATCRSVLERHRVPFHADDDAIVVGPSHASGAYCRFRAHRE